jgi:hypothetical protein
VLLPARTEARYSLPRNSSPKAEFMVVIRRPSEEAASVRISQTFDDLSCMTCRCPYTAPAARDGSAQAHPNRPIATSRKVRRATSLNPTSQISAPCAGSPRSLARALGHQLPGHRWFDWEDEIAGEAADEEASNAAIIGDAQSGSGRKVAGKKLSAVALRKPLSRKAAN